MIKFSSLLIKNIKIFDIQPFGKAKDHVKILFQKNNGQTISAIKFFAEDILNSNVFNPGDHVNLIAFIEKSTFGYSNELRLRILHIFK